MTKCRNKARQTTTPTKKRHYNLKHRYGITGEEYEKLLEAQNCRCKICGTTEPGNKAGSFVVDHDHDSKEVRGLLCFACNIMLGHAKDNVETLSSAIRYLEVKRNTST